MVDLHMHTTASDGRSAPDMLVAEVAARGLRVMAVTDHDTTAAADACLAAARDAGVTCHVGIEVSAVARGRDIHILGYGFDRHAPALVAFLEGQRRDRSHRIRAIGERLAQLGVPVDLDRAIADAGHLAGRSIGRPVAAAALVAAGHVRDLREAFDRYLGDGKPACVPRTGPSPAAVVELLTRVGGVASLAHPGKYDRDDLLAPLVSAGLAAIEVHHPDHDPIDTARYRQIAQRYGLLVTGGSDYHGVGSAREAAFGHVRLPADDYARLADRLSWPALQ